MMKHCYECCNLPSRSLNGTASIQIVSCRSARQRTPQTVAPDYSYTAWRRITMELKRRAFLTATAATTAAVATNAFGLDKFGRDRDWTGNTPVTYPEPAFEVLDKRFTGRQGNATLQRIWHGMGNDAALWCEGPVWMGDWGCLLWR